MVRFVAVAFVPIAQVAFGALGSSFVAYFFQAAVYFDVPLEVAASAGPTAFALGACSQVLYY